MDYLEKTKSMEKTPCPKCGRDMKLRCVVCDEMPKVFSKFNTNYIRVTRETFNELKEIYKGNNPDSDFQTDSFIDDRTNGEFRMYFVKRPVFESLVGAGKDQHNFVVSIINDLPVI